MLEGRNKLKTVEAQPQNEGFFLFRKKGKSDPKKNAGNVSRKERKVKVRTTKPPKNNIRQGANYNTTGGGVSIDNTPRSAPRYSEPKKIPRVKSKVRYKSKSEKVSRQRRRIPMIRFSPRIGIYNPDSPNPRYSKNPGFDRTRRYAATPRYSVPQPRVSPQSVNPRYSQSQGFVVKKGGYVFGYRSTKGIIPIAKAGPRYSKAPKPVSPSSVSPRYSQSDGFVTGKPKWVFGFKKTPGFFPIAKAGPRYSKDPGIVPPGKVSPRYSKAPKPVSPASVSPRFSEEQGFVTNKSKWVFGFKKTPGPFPIVKAGPRYSKAQRIVPPGSVSPRYSQEQGFVVKKGGWVFGFKKTPGLLPIAKEGPRVSKEAGFYKPSDGIDRSVSAGYSQFSLPPKEKRSNNHHNPIVSTAIPEMKLTRRQRNFTKKYNEMITGWQGYDTRVSKLAEKLQDKGYALMYSEYQGFLKVPTEKRADRLAENKAGDYADYTGGFKIKRRKGEMHPSIAYISGKKINSRKLRKEWRELNIIFVRLEGNKEIAKGVKNGPDKPKYDRKERDIWNY